MPVEDSRLRDLEDIVSAGGLVLVLGRAPDCGACRAFEPVFARVAESHPEHRFLRLDITAEEGAAEAVGIEHTPALLVYREGILLFRQAGGYDEPALADIVLQAATLDMDSVRADITASTGPGQEQEEA